MCSMVNGSCLNGCTIGYYGMKCENMCSSTCAEGCGLDGNCTGGKCKSGYSGPTCLDGMDEIIWFTFNVGLHICVLNFRTLLI